MVRMMLAAVLALGIWAPVGAQDGPRATVQGTVQGQIEAFLRDDLEAAFDFASPGIRRFFGDPGQFGAMVRRGFPMVWRPADVRFLELREYGGLTFQNVMIRDGDGVFHVLEYQMELAENGWQINGVRIVVQPEVGA